MIRARVLGVCRVLGAVVALVAVGCDSTVVTLGAAPGDAGAPQGGTDGGSGTGGTPNGGAGSGGTGNGGTESGGTESGGTESGGTENAGAGFGGGAGNPPELPVLPRVGAIRRLDELSTEGENDNPTLTGDLLEIYFTSDREGGSGSTDVWRAERTRVTDTFGEPELVSAVSSEAYESSSAVSLDGRRLWVGSERDGGQGELDIWFSEREGRGAPWSAARVVPELSSPEKDIPRPLGFEGTLMPLGSQRESPGTYRMFFARSTGAGFDTPEVVPELAFEDRGSVDGFLSDDGRSLFFTLVVGEDDGDLYVARRRTTDQPFEEPESLADLNTDADERDPWLSPDGTRFFFASDRDGVLAIYEATVLD